MKFNRLFLALAMGFAAVSCSSNVKAADTNDDAASEEVAKEKTAADFKSSRKLVNEVSYLVGVNFGSFIKNYDFGELNMSEVRKGMNDFINAKMSNDPEEFAKQFKIDPNKMNELFNEYLSNRHNYKLYSNKEREEKFLEKNAKKAGVVVTASGLQYKIVSAGNEVHPSASDTVYVKYRGTLLDGTVFDETKADAEAVALPLSNMIEGWKEGLPLIGEGGEIELYIPYALGYGERGGRGPIGPAETLIFNVSLEKVGAVAPAKAAE